MEFNLYNDWREYTLFDSPQKEWRAFEIRDELNDIFHCKESGEPWNLRDIQQYIRAGRIPSIYGGGWRIILVRRNKSRWLKYKGNRLFKLEKLI